MIVGISGKARSGKDTFGKFLAEELSKSEAELYILMAYATELKNKVQKDFDLSYAQLWGDKKEVEDKRYPKPDGSGFWTAREILQNYGQFYRTIDYRFWIKKLFDVIDDKNYKNVIITDLRHPNEVDAVLDKGGFHIKIIRPSKSKPTIHNSKHISETALEKDYKVDIKVNNDGNLDALKNNTKEVVKALYFLLEGSKSKNNK